MSRDSSSRLPNDQLPFLYQVANRASLTGQRSYMLVLKADLVAITLAAAVGAISGTDGETARVVYAIVAFLFIAGFLLTLVLQLKNFDRKWYGGRAAAESVKTLAWRYAVRAEPFDGSDEQAVDGQLIAALRSVLSQREELAIEAEPADVARSQITDAMRKLRSASCSERRDAYLTDRVADQQDWYQSKSRMNKKNERLYFLLVLACQLLAIIYSIALVVWPTIPFNAPGSLATLAAGFLVWMQAKQYQELAQAYAVAAQELALIAEQGRHVPSDVELSRFVSDAESAISREHTLWAARRDYLPRLTRI